MNDKVKKYLTIIEIAIGDFVFALLCQIVTVFVTKRILYYSLGLWLGAFMAVACAIHMYRTLDKALDFEEKDAVSIAKKGALIRYFALCFIFALIMIFDVVNPLTTFLGLMGLKMGAYMEPFTHKFLIKINYIEPDPIPVSLEELENNSEEKTINDIVTNKD